LPVTAEVSGSSPVAAVAAGNRAVTGILARRPNDAAPPIKDRTRIDQLAKTKGQAAADRCKAYAEIAGTQSVQMDPAAVHTSAFYQDGVTSTHSSRRGTSPRRRTGSTIPTDPVAARRRRR
jgi:hypothetical protein